MSFDADKLLSLLPALYRIRDAEQAQQAGLAQGPLSELLALVAGQIAVVEEDLEQLYDDAFIETCAEWAIPYIGDLIGYRPLHGVAPRVVSRRAEVAHTVAYRRRKGTITVLEQLARDVTGWNARAVEFFQCLATTQYTNHLRPHIHAAPDLRRWEPLQRIGTAFDRVPRTVDVRRIASGRGRHNIPNVGLFLWRIDAYPLSRSPCARVDDRRFRFSPLNRDQPLYTSPQTEDEITQLATPLNAPLPIARRVLREHLADYYGDGSVRRSLRLYVGTVDPLPLVPVEQIRSCHLGDDAGGWAHLPPTDVYAVDPVLGRIALPPGLPADTRVEADWHYGFSAGTGGGEYERGDSTAVPPTLRVPDDHESIQDALDALGGSGIVEIADSGRYEEDLSIAASAGARVELRAANGCRPTLLLSAPLALSGGTDAQITLDGLMIAGARLEVATGSGNALRRLALHHCTLVPGLALAEDGTPVSAAEPSLVAALPDLQIAIERCIVGALRVDAGAEVALRDAIVDACVRTGVAYAAPDGESAGGPLSCEASTVVGKLHALKLALVSNSILLAELTGADTWAAPVLAQRRQEGCVRFSWLPADSRVPRRHRCVPGADTSPVAVPQFTSLRYGDAGYAQLRAASTAAVLAGADDEGQMGAFHHLYQPQRETNLRVRLDEYLRVGLEAGIFYDS